MVPISARQAREQGPDLILLNVQLPGMSADAVLAGLHGQPATPHIPVLMISADATVATRQRLLALGADDYLLKPFNVNVLAAKLDTLLATGLGEPES